MNKLVFTVITLVSFTHINAAEEFQNHQNTQTNELRSTAVAQDLPMPEFTEPGEHVPNELERSPLSDAVTGLLKLYQSNADPNQKLPPELELLQACITSGCFLMIMRNNNASNPITSTPSNSSGECIFLPKKRDSIPL